MHVVQTSIIAMECKMGGQQVEQQALEHSGCVPKFNVNYCGWLASLLDQEILLYCMHMLSI